MKFFVCAAIFAAICLVQIDAHGMMMNPASRSTRWRYDSSAPANYNDNELFCGGLGVMTANGGRCGICGDNWASATPRPNELGGKYGQGVIVRSVAKGQTMKVSVKLTANHLGYFQFHLCNLDQYGGETEDCFNRQTLRFPDGSDKLYIGSTNGEFDVDVVVPAVTCQRCVLRWTYVGGNNWGICADGSNKQGCGPQETFKNCADISIY